MGSNKKYNNKPVNKISKSAYWLTRNRLIDLHFINRKKAATAKPIVIICIAKIKFLISAKCKISWSWYKAVFKSAWPVMYNKTFSTEDNKSLGE